MDLNRLKKYTNIPCSIAGYFCQVLILANFTGPNNHFNKFHEMSHLMNTALHCRIETTQFSTSKSRNFTPKKITRNIVRQEQTQIDGKALHGQWTHTQM